MIRLFRRQLQARQGSMISMPHPAKSRTLRRYRRAGNLADEIAHVMGVAPFDAFLLCAAGIANRLLCSSSAVEVTSMTSSIRA
jgi:hypothetical protein